MWKRHKSLKNIYIKYDYQCVSSCGSCSWWRWRRLSRRTAPGTGTAARPCASACEPCECWTWWRSVRSPRTDTWTASRLQKKEPQLSWMLRLNSPLHNWTERIHTGVRAHVFLQVSGGFEGFVAHVLRTFIGFFSGVRAQVTLEPISCGKGFTAGWHLAPVRTVTGVRTLMHLCETHTDVSLWRPAQPRCTVGNSVPSDGVLWCSIGRSLCVHSGNSSLRPAGPYQSSRPSPQTSAEKHTHTYTLYTMHPSI